MPQAIHIGQSAGYPIIEPEPVPGRQIAIGFMHPGTADNWDLHPAEMRDIDGVPHVVAAHWSKPVDS
jgi:hypothetical protein